MNGKVLPLRVSFWAGAILDAMALATMVFPSLFAWNNRLPDFHPGVDYSYAMHMGAPLMLGWTVLLLWADRKPLERRNILWITLLVVMGEVATEIYGVSVGFIAAGALVSTWILQFAISALFLFSLWRASR
jgi:hypothetical protein